MENGSLETKTDVDLPDELEDLEVCAKEGRRPRCVRRYAIRIDRERYIAHVTYMTGGQLLELAGKCDVDRWKIFQKLRGGEVKEIGHNDKVDFTAKGIEKFKTLPLDQTEGEAAELSRCFELPPGDKEFLESYSEEWETICDGSANWLLIHGFEVPDGLTHRAATVALRIEPCYPDTQIDMAYFDPPLCRRDGKTIPALSNQTIAGRTYQRWSRHRTNDNPWRPGVDEVSTHLMQVRHWLEKESFR